MAKNRHFYNGTHYTIDKENKVVRLTPEFHAQMLGSKLWGRFGFKKIGGSSIGDILGADKVFGSKFKASLNLMWLGTPIFDMKYIDAGNKMEPRVIDVMSQVKGKKLRSYDSARYNYNYFSDNPDAGEFFNGVPDATDDDAKQLYELKAVGKKNQERWEQYGVPEKYRMQAAVYDYLLWGKNAGTLSRNPKLVALFLEPDDYGNEENVDLSKRTIKSYDVPYSITEVEGWLREAKDFRDIVMQHGVSYPYDLNNQNDAKALEFLECTDQDDYDRYLKRNGYQ